VLGVVPARGGSKAVPRKNARELGGRPLIAYTIDAARESAQLSELVVSTEDDEIAKIASGLGAAVVARPPELALDTTPMVPVIQHALQVTEAETNSRYDAVATLQPTTPFRTAVDIDEAIELLQASGADSVIGVVRIYDVHPARVKRIEGQRLLSYCVSEDETTRRQDLPPAYLRNGAIYVTRRDVVDRGSLRGSDQCPYEMPAERSVNIDGPLDFLLAEALVRVGADGP